MRLPCGWANVKKNLDTTKNFPQDFHKRNTEISGAGADQKGS